MKPGRCSTAVGSAAIQRQGGARESPKGEYVVHYIKQFGLVLAAIAATTVATSPPASAGCSDTCAAGAAGTGGSASDGAAQGFRLEGPSRISGATFTNSGNDIAGHVTISGTVNGAGSGAITPRGQLVGHYEGFTAQLFLGSPETCNGICAP